MGNLVNYKSYEDGYAVITINRPEKRNAISRDVINEFKQVVRDIHYGYHSDKLIIITGSGHQAFCAGGDLNDFHGEMDEADSFNLLKDMQEVLWDVVTLPVPTIAWMNGSARGGGMELASACDFRFVHEQGTYGFTQGQLGISTGWGGGTLLYERIHPQDAYEWLVKADVRSAEQLKEIRFSQDSFTNSQLDSKHELLKPFISRSYEQLRHWKSQWLESRELNILKQRMDDEVEACSRLWVSEAHKQAVDNFFTRKQN
ncbi:enoyl-CoA hydratase/isomerase family protein [Alkalibacillus aidingensis]|uniref:enoyl-CoA hydratase/isomerase family protein n=1 Tax=Alkalibacillus aidingensis TaxID=2747607 RepID=UPI0016610DF2|nr:enoyl-CoA hydratase/isomerase family protein [Alkalibacillus aidingensis]